MSAQPPPGYDPSVSKLEGAGADSVPIIKMSGGGLPEPSQNYIDGGYEKSLLAGSHAEVPIERQSGGANGKELLGQLQITENEFDNLGIQDLTFADFTAKLESCNGPQDLEAAGCETVREALKTIFINRLRTYIEECKGFTADEGVAAAEAPFEFGLTAAPIAAPTLPAKLIYDQAKKIWRSPKTFEDEGAAIAPEKGQWVPKGDGTWIPATPSTARGAPGTAAGPKYMKEFPKGSGTFVPATQADIGAIPVSQGAEWKKVVTKSVFGAKETWLPPERPEAVAAREAATVAAEEGKSLKATEPVAKIGEILGAPTVEPPTYPTSQEAAANFSKIKVVFDLINFLPTIYKGIPQPNTQAYEYKTISELIRATAAIFANIIPSMRTPERTKELETFKISTAFPNLTKTIGTSLVMDKDAKNRILKFISEHQDVFKVSAVDDKGIIESIYTQLLNFIGDIGNLTIYNRLHGTDMARSTVVDNFAESLFPKLTAPGLFATEGKANYISIFYQNPNPVSMPTEQYGTTLFAYRTGMPYVSKELTKTEIPVQMQSILSKAVPIKIDTFNFNSLMYRFFSNYGPISEEDEKLFDLIHKDISGFDMIFNLFVKHDANPFSSFANTASPDGKFGLDKKLDEYVADAINDFSAVLSDPMSATIVDPDNLFGTNDDDIFTKLLERLKNPSMNLGFGFDQYMAGFDAIFSKLDDEFVSRGATNERPVTDEGVAKYKKHLESFMIICDYLTTFMEPDDPADIKTQYQTIFGKIYNYYVRLYNDKKNGGLAIIGGDPTADPATNGDPASILSAKQVDNMNIYFKGVFSSSNYYVGNIFELLFKRYLKNNKNILSILPANVDPISSDADLYETLQHFRALLTPVAGAQQQPPLVRKCGPNAAGRPPRVADSYNEIIHPGRVDTPEFISEYKRNPLDKRVHLEILFDHIKNNSNDLTSADITYVINLKNTLLLNNYAKAVEDIFYIHASLKKKYGSEYKYGHKPIDKFNDPAIIGQLNNSRYFSNHIFDVKMLVDLLHDNNKMDSMQSDLYNSCRRTILQFIQPYFEQSYLDFFNKTQTLFNSIIANRATITDPNVQVALDQINILLPQINDTINNLMRQVNGVFVYTTEISNFINGNQNLRNGIKTLITAINQHTELIRKEEDYELQIKNIMEYLNIFVNIVSEDIRAELLIIRNIYKAAPYNDQKTPASEPILKSFYKPSEADNAWTSSTWDKLINNPTDISYVKYFAIMSQLMGQRTLPAAVATSFMTINSFFVYTIQFKLDDYLGARPEQKDDAEEEDDDKLNAFEVSGLKFMEYPVDILYGAPGSPERKNFIQLIIALLNKLLSLVLQNPKNVKERIKSFFYLMNQFELVLYSIGEQENTDFVAFKGIFNIDILSRFIKLAYEKYYKETKQPGKDSAGFDSTKVIKTIGKGQWVVYPYKKDIKTWFGGSADDSTDGSTGGAANSAAEEDLEMDMKGGWFGLIPAAAAILTGGLLYQTNPVRGAVSGASNWITSLFGISTAIQEPVKPNMTIAAIASRNSNELTSFFETTFYSNPQLLIATQKKLLFDSQFGLGNNSIKKMIQQLNTYNIPVNILALPTHGGNLYENQNYSISNFMIPPSGIDITSTAFITYINSIFPDLTDKNADTLFGQVRDYLFKRGQQEKIATADLKEADIKKFIQSLDAVIVKFRKHFRDKYKALYDEIKKEELDVYNSSQGELTADRDKLISMKQDKIKELRIKKNLIITNLLSLADIRNNPFLKMKNIISSTLSNQQFPAAVGKGAAGFFDIETIPAINNTFKPPIRIDMRDPIWKILAIDAILYMQQLYNKLSEKYPEKDTVQVPVMAGDPIFSLRGDARKNKINERYNTLISNFNNNNILNSDKDISLLIDTWGKQIIGLGGADAVVHDESQSLFSRLARTNFLDGFFCSSQSLKLYAYSKTNITNAISVIKEYVAFNKILFNQFKELICILADPDVLKNELLAHFANNPIVDYMKVARINLPKKEKGKVVKLDKTQKNDINNKLNDCFKLFLTSQDPYEYGELFSVLYFITTKPVNAKLEKAFKPKANNFENAFKTLMAYCEYDIKFEPPLWYGQPTSFVPAPMPPRQRFKMFDQPTTEVKYNLAGVKHQEFIANRQLYNLLYDSISSRHEFYNKHIRNINERKKKDTNNIKFPKIDRIETGTNEELKYLASILYAYGFRARNEMLQRLEEGSPEAELVKTFAGYSFTGGEGMDFTDEEVKAMADRIDITRLDIQAPPYMFLTEQQRVFACEKAMAKIHELKYEQVLTLLITLLGSYETQGIKSDDVLIEKDGTLKAQSIQNIKADVLERLRTASLVIRYDGLASHFVDDWDQVNELKYKVKGILQVPEYYKLFLNNKYGKIDIKQLADLDEETRKEYEEEEADVIAILDAAEEPLEGDAEVVEATEPEGANNAGLVAPNPQGQAGGDPLVVHNRTRRGSKHHSNYRSTARREHVNREHNKHTRKNK